MPKLALAIGLFLLLIPSATADERVSVTDLAGRHVTLERPAKRILLLQGRHLPALSLIHPDPASIIVGWQSDMQRQDPATYEAFKRKFPAFGRIPIVGDGTPNGLAIEKAIALQPDLVISSYYTVAGGGSIAESTILKRFESAGIPVVIIDFFTNPLRDTANSVSILGKVIGREEQAETFRRFYEAHMARLTQTLAAAQPKRPTVFMHAHAGGAECCYSSGKGTFDDFITVAGGRNVAVSVIPGSTGQVSLEYLIMQDPEVYVATGGAHLASRGGLVLGTGVEPAEARRRFDELLARPGLSGLTAVARGRAHGLWHMFNDSPSHIVALEWLAKWFHPELFKDLDPSDTLREINGFSAVPLEGTYWVERP